MRKRKGFVLYSEVSMNLLVTSFFPLWSKAYSASNVTLKWELAVLAPAGHSTIKSIRSPGYKIPTDEDSGDISMLFPPSTWKTVI